MLVSFTSSAKQNFTRSLLFVVNTILIFSCMEYSRHLFWNVFSGLKHTHSHIFKSSIRHNSNILNSPLYNAKCIFSVYPKKVPYDFIFYGKNYERIKMRRKSWNGKNAIKFEFKKKYKYSTWPLLRLLGVYCFECVCAYFQVMVVINADVTGIVNKSNNHYSFEQPINTKIIRK